MQEEEKWKQRKGKRHKKQKQQEQEQERKLQEQTCELEEREQVLNQREQELQEDARRNSWRCLAQEVSFNACALGAAMQDRTTTKEQADRLFQQLQVSYEALAQAAQARQ